MSGIDLEAAYKHCRRHRAELEASGVCGCFHCGAIFPPDETAEWVNKRRPRDEWSAICSHCGINAVIGDASGLPIEIRFLDVMRTRWFERAVPHSEAAKRIGSKR